MMMCFPQVNNAKAAQQLDLSTQYILIDWFSMTSSQVRDNTKTKHRLLNQEESASLFLTYGSLCWLRTQKLKPHLLRTQSLKVLPPFKNIHVTPTTSRVSFLANFYLSGPFTCICPKPLASFSWVGCG